jgi:ribosomal protein S18 acetylase RimI-like enzyme
LSPARITNIKTRNLKESDYLPIKTVINDWWGGRQMADLLPRLFFTHFRNTSFVVEEEGQIVAFLVGFLSQTHPGEAYIHFVGVHPDYRQKGLGRHLYDRFFETVKQSGVHTVRCITSPVNKGSIAYHTKMGFLMEPGDVVEEGVPVHKDYDGPGRDRVLFVKKLW